MSLINDDKFMQQAIDSQDASQVFNQRSYNKADLIGIGDKDRWEASKLAGLVGVDQIPDDDPLPTGTLVEFTAPDSTTYRGRVASKSGKDYVVEISQGESYLVPPGRLAKITPENDAVREAMQRYVSPDLELVSKPSIEVANRCCARVAYKSRRPTDNELLHWASNKYPDWRLVDAIDGNNREIGLIFEIDASKVAYEDTKPQGGDQNVRGMGLARESVEGTGVEPEPALQPHKEAGIVVEMEVLPSTKFAMSTIEPPSFIDDGWKPEQKRVAQSLGEPGGAEAYEDLVRAARWVLARFNDSNPEFYAIPQEAEMAGGGTNRVVRLSFVLQKKDGEDLNHMYISRSGKLEEAGGPDSSPARGFVQVDSEGNLPMIMLNTPIGPESVQEYGFDFTAERKWADYDACMTAANEVLSTYGGYSAEAQADFDARLVKLGVDPKAKEYWGGYFKDYGKMFTRDIPRKKHKTTDKPQKKSNREPLDLRKLAHKKVAVDQKAKDYWSNYFGSGVFNDKWYGEAMTRNIPRTIAGDIVVAPKEKKEAIKKLASDYASYIKEEDGKYCVKSKSNQDWSGGCYESKGAAEERLKQVEMFKHMAMNACVLDEHVPTTGELGAYIDLAMMLKERRAQIESALKGYDKRKKQDVQMGGLFGGSVPLKDLVETAQWAMQISADDQNMYEAIYGLVYDYLRKNPGFLPTMLHTNTLDEKGVGFTLLYALRDSPRAFKQFQKHINKYQKRYQSQQWKDMEKKTKDWREQQREMKRKDKDKSDPKKERGEGPSQFGGEPEADQPDQEELVVELDEEPAVVEVQPEDFTILDEPKAQPQQAQPPPPPPGAIEESKAPPQQVAQPAVPSLLVQPTREELRKYSENDMIIRQAAAGTGPATHNAPGKDDKKDYAYKERRKQPSRHCTRFCITRMYSTTSSEDNGYVFMDIGWEPKDLEALSPQNVQQQIISYVKGLESNKEFHDFGIMGKIRIVEFDNDAGVARVKLRCSNTRGIPTLGYTGDIDEPIAITGIR